MIIFMTALGCYLNSRLGWLASSAGIMSGVASGLIGVFPMNGFRTHAAVAYSFFYSGLVAVLLFILVIMLDKDHKVPKWLLVPGITCAAVLVSFLMAPHFTQPIDVETFGAAATRPRIWPVALLEWLVFFCVTIWIVLASVYLATRKPLSDR